MFYLMKLKYAIFSNSKVTKIERSVFFGHQVYAPTLYIFQNQIIGMAANLKDSLKLCVQRWKYGIYV